MKHLNSIHNVDLILFNWCMARRRRQLLTALGRAVSKTADGGLYVVFAFGYGLLDWPNSQNFLKIFALAFGIERCLYFVAKNTFRRNRPADAISDFNSFIVPSDQFSFPSGHTSAAFLFAVFVGSIFPVLFSVLIAWAVCVAISRIFLGVHFPTDTLVGAGLGSSVALFALQLGGLV